MALIRDEYFSRKSEYQYNITITNGKYKVDMQTQKCYDDLIAWHSDPNNKFSCLCYTTTLELIGEFDNVNFEGFDQISLTNKHEILVSARGHHIWERDDKWQIHWGPSNLIIYKDWKPEERKKLTKKQLNFRFLKLQIHEILQIGIELELMTEKNRGGLKDYELTRKFIERAEEKNSLDELSNKVMTFYTKGELEDK